MTRLFRTLIAFSFLLSVALLPAREATLPYSRRGLARPLNNLKPLVVAATDVAGEIASDARLGFPAPLRFAATTEVEITPATHGTWEPVAGGRIWRLRITSDGATDLNFGFSRCHLPDGVTLHLSSETEDYTQGAFTAADNQPHGQLWTPVVPGGQAVIEVFVPDNTKEPELTLTHINRGYRDMFNRRKDLNLAKAGSCNNDVICPVGDPWRNEIRSVARYSINGSGLCTGTLINDAAGDAKNYFLTANHCGVSAGNAATVVVYWNFQSPACGQHGGGSLSQNQSGAIFRMAKSDVDVTLLELAAMPDASFNVYYSGWDRSGAASAGVVGIHHPNGDEKSISFANATITTVNSCIGTGGSGTHWNVVWNSGVTEPGSSGSGIWNPTTHLLLGTLSGGGSACSTPTLADCYGKFSVAWNLGTTAATRLRDWLDPLNTGITNVPGRDSVVAVAPTVALVSAKLAGESCVPTNGVIDPGESVTISFTLTNTGGTAITNLTGTLLAGTGVSAPGAPQSYGGMPVGGVSVARPFTFIATGSCGGLVTTRLFVQEGGVTLGTFTNTFPLGALNVAFAENFDGLVPPALPAGWINFQSGVGALWVTTNGVRDTLPNSIFAPDAAGVSDEQITSPPIFITTPNAQLTFRHRYDLENTYDGGVLEIAIGAGAFSDILSNGGAFLLNGYTQPISSSFGNPLAGRAAWSGLTTNFITSTVLLPPSAAGKNVRFRWRLGTDSSVANTGWYVDSVAVLDGSTCCSSAVPLVIQKLRRVGGNVAFSFVSSAGQNYTVEYKGSLNTSNWIVLQTIPGDGTLKNFTNTLTTTNRFFRLRSP